MISARSRNRRSGRLTSRNTARYGTRSRASRPKPPLAGLLKRMLRILKTAPKFAVTTLIVLAIVNLLLGVFLRYFVGAITDWLDVDPVPFTWVEEVGELSLAWLTLIGAAIGIQSRSHFALAVFVHRLPHPVQLWIHRFNHALIAGVGGLVAW